MAAATVGMIVNNAIVLWGLWAMLFDGKPNSHALTIYFLALNAMLTVAWGTACVVFGGLYSLNTYIDEGSLEPMMATPRPTILLVAISKSLPAALGDIVQGLISLGVFVLTGSLPFFVKRGSNLSLLLREVCLSLSFYPTGKVFGGAGRLFLFLTPAAVIGLLPMGAVENGTWSAAAVSIAASCFLLWISLKVFSSGLTRYQTASYVSARG